jgi:putative colanic acid biosynthesis UDP-glucose lipid carrier transferase
MQAQTLTARLDQWRSRRALTATDPSFVFAMKTLLYPVLAVISLLVCMAIWHEPLSGPQFLLAVVIFFLAGEILDVAGFRGTHGIEAVWSLLDILVRWVLTVAFIWMLLHLSHMSRIIQSGMLRAWALATPFVLWAGQLTFQRALDRGRERAELMRKAVVIGASEVGLRLARKLQSTPSLRMQLVGCFDDGDAESLPSDCDVPMLGKPVGLPEFVWTHSIHAVYVTLPMTNQARVLSLLEQLQDSTVSIYFVPDVLICDLIQARLDVIGGIPIVAIRESPFYGTRGMVKRLSDILMALTFLLLSAPLLLLVAIGVRADSRGPIFFRQRRYGLDGREIFITKFRSMTVMEDGVASYTQVKRNDNRVTRFGAFIRKTSLDELPQLFDVLRGTLSIVGPRPHAVAVNEQYRRLIPGYMIRHKVKPGITGWAQVNGYRGGDDLESMRNRIEFDLDYLRNWSLALDLLIVLQTLPLVWRDSRAF